MIKVTLTFTSIAAAMAALAAIPADAIAAYMPADGAPSKPGNGAKAAPTAAPKPETAAPAPSPSSSSKPSQSPEKAADTDTTKALDYEKDVRPLILKMGTAGKRDALVEILSGFGVAKGTELKPEQYAEVKDKLEAALA